MVKQEYLSRLRSSLADFLNTAEVEDIIGDYKEYFTSGESDGLSEPEICANLGTPEELAATIMRDSSETAASRSLAGIRALLTSYARRFWKPVALCLMLLIYLGISVNYFRDFSLFVLLQFISTLVVPALLLYLTGAVKYLSGQKSVKHLKQLTIIPCCLVALTMIFVFTVLTRPAHDLVELGPILRNYIDGGILLGAALSMFAIIIGYSRRSVLVTVVFVIMGMVASLFNLTWLLQGASSLDFFMRSNIPAFLPLFFSVPAMIIATFVLERAVKKAKRGW